MDDAPQPGDLPANLRFLRVLVTTLAVTMIAGLLTIVGLLVMRFNAPAPAMGELTVERLAADLALPEGAEALSVSVARDVVVVLTTDARILILDRATGALRQSVPLNPAK